MTTLSFEPPIEVYCDECGFIFDARAQAWRAALIELKKHNWTMRQRRVNGEIRWQHLCGDCNGRNKINPRGIR